MKWIVISSGIAGILCLGIISPGISPIKGKKSMEINGSYAPVAVLELFTSEGCSSCPPADRLLPQLLKQGDNIIPLSFHVDYWNRLGWTDPFSSPDYSERQRMYSEQFRLESVYTPQLIVNGEYEMVGSNKSKVTETLQKVLAGKAGTQLQVSDVRKNGSKLNFTVHTEGDFKKTDLVAILLQKKAVVKVKAGENSGAELSHIDVVRSFKNQVTTDRNEFQFEIPTDLENNNWQIVIFTQQKTGLKINGAARYDPLTTSQ
jgi:hypothetical protein